MRISVLPYLLLLAALGGCATQAELAAQAERDVDRMVAVYGPACAKFGFARDTDPWRDCVLRLSMQDSVQRAGSYPVMSTCVGRRGFVDCTYF